MASGVRLIVEGSVQGVGYRFFAARAAQELGIRGWVRNRPDGSVEAQASAEPAALDAFVRRLRQGPPGSRVSRVKVREFEGEGEGEGFDIRG